MSFREKTIPFYMFASILLLGGCAERHGVTTKVAEESVLSGICYLPNGLSENLTIPLTRIKKEAFYYQKDIVHASKKKKPLPADFIPSSYTINRNNELFTLNYKPTLSDNETITLSGYVTCGKGTGTQPDGSYVYAIGLHNVPINLQLTPDMKSFRLTGIGGYSVVIMNEKIYKRGESY